MWNEKNASRETVETPYVLRRVLHDAERRYLTCDAQGVVYRYMASEEVPSELIEKAIQEAVSIGKMRSASVDGPFFEMLVETLLEDCSFGLFSGETERVYPSGCWVC
jgi:hypothetical protein